jgi:hypothetical protein
MPSKVDWRFSESLNCRDRYANGSRRSPRDHAEIERRRPAEGPPNGVGIDQSSARTT